MSDRIDYRTAAPPKPLDIPPDLSQLPKDDRYQVPSANAAAAAKGQQAATPAAGNVVPAVSIARMERDGTQRWLAVDQPPEQVIDQVRELFKAVGLGIDRDDPNLGIIETVWAENHARLPLDFLRRIVGKAFDSVYSTSELDKYRARIERTAANTSEVFISHRGMAEVYTNTQHDQTIWQLRPSEPELEAELLRRLQLRFLPAATTAAAASTAPAEARAAPQPQNARFVPGSGAAEAKVLIDEPFDRAWRRVGLALDRGGFTVEDRDRTKGLYFVRYLDPEYEAKMRDKQGFFSRVFGRDPKIDAQQFRIVVAANAGNGTDVSVQDKEGKPDASATGSKILAQITEQMR
ncbi:MAG TPA: outer membrane protein assembly factor BamC [Burkholderiaceae bacterium]|nr:outer membrane protein assembly factor BamC [Burkholderiaceae bacterium]